MNGGSQSCKGRKQVEKATVLQIWTVSSELGRMTQRVEPGAQRTESRATEDYFQGAELCSNRVADDMCQADFTIALALLRNVPYV